MTLFCCTHSMVEGVKPDPDCPEPPLSSILQIVARTDDVALVRQYGTWLVGQASVDSSAVWAAIGGDAFGSRSEENDSARRSLLMGLVKQRVKLEKGLVPFAVQSPKWVESRADRWRHR